MKKLLPNIYQKDIYNINYKSLKEKGIDTLVFDMDNTLISYKIKKVPKEVIKLFKELRNDEFKIYILSNSLPKRLNKLINGLEIDGALAFACKPLSHKYKKLIKLYNLNPNKIACIGDQIYTDVKGANKMKLLSILIDPISKEEHPLTKLNRKKEKKIYNKYLKRGEYYE